MRAKFTSDAPLLETIPQYLLELGGKRIRPVLTLMSAQGFGMREPSQELIEVAAGIEMIHMATLLHDDIIDESQLRRHQESPYRRYGTTDTLLAGDFLLVRAFSLCARLDSFIIDSTERACVALTEGEILETSLNREKHSVDTSLLIARKKTAALFWLAARAGAHLATNGASDVVEAMSSFGEYLGTAFQIVDDILDVTSDFDLLGKPAGIDLREKKPSLVNVLWLKAAPETAKAILEGPNSLSPEDVQHALQQVRKSPVVDEARDIAETFIEKAREELERGRTRSANTHEETFLQLHCLLDYTLSRMR